MNLNPTIKFVIFFFIGVALGLFFDLNIFHSLFLGFLVLIFSIIFLLKKEKVYLAIIIALIGFSIGVARAVIENNKEIGASLNASIGQEVEIEGRISSNPEKRANTLRFIMNPIEYDEKILIYAEKFLSLQYGDEIKLKGEIQEIENFEGLGGRIFDYKNYLAKDDIYYQIFYPDIKINKKNSGNSLIKALFDLRNSLTGNIKKIIRRPESALMSGLLFGEKSSFNDKLEEDFRKTGLVHIVVLSGYNVSIVAQTIMRSLSFLPFIISSSLGVLAILFFAVMTGLGAATVRASIMAGVVILSNNVGRKYDIFKALFVAGFLMVFFNPEIILYDPGFQLSFMATLGLLLLSPILISKLKTLNVRYIFLELLVATIATQIFVLPILLYQIGEVSLISPLANILILPLIPTTMLWGFLTSVTVFVSKWLALLPGYFSYLLLSLEIKVTETLANLSFSSVTVPRFSPIFVFVFYAIIFWLLKKHKNSTH